MPTLPTNESASDRPGYTGLHVARTTAESFGIDAAGYDLARPEYPPALIRQVIAGLSGTDILDVGCGTGIAARQFRAAGCTVLGVEPDARMADYARTRGLPVEVAMFEDWDPAGRAFDAVIAAQSWHWVNPVAGTAKAAAALRPGGRLAIFGHVLEPPASIARAFAEAFGRVVPESPFARQDKRTVHRNSLEAYQAGYAAVADKINSSGLFNPAELARFDWQRTYSRDEWLRLLPTTGGLTSVDPERRRAVLAPVGQAIDQLGGSFTSTFTTLIITAQRA